MHFPILSSCAERGEERGGDETRRESGGKGGEARRREERRRDGREERRVYNRTVGGIIQKLIADGALCRVTKTEFK